MPPFHFPLSSCAARWSMLSMPLLSHIHYIDIISNINTCSYVGDCNIQCFTLCCYAVGLCGILLCHYHNREGGGAPGARPPKRLLIYDFLMPQTLNCLSCLTSLQNYLIKARSHCPGVNPGVSRHS